MYIAHCSLHLKNPRTDNMYPGSPMSWRIVVY